MTRRALVLFGLMSVIWGIPYLFIATPFVMVAYVPAFAFFISRFGTPRVLGYTLLGLVGGGVVLFVWIPSATEAAEACALTPWMM